MSASSLQNPRVLLWLAASCGAGFFAFLVWVVLFALLWIDGGFALYRYYPVPQVLSILALLAVVSLLLPLGKASWPQGLARLLICFLLAPFAWGIAYEDFVGAERREFLLKAHSVQPGDALADVQEKFAGYSIWQGADWITFHMSPGPASNVGIQLELADDHQTVASIRFKSD